MSGLSRYDVDRLIRDVGAVGGPRLRAVRRLPGGAIGAWLVADTRGREFVMTWGQRLSADEPSDLFDRSRTMMELAISAGVPAPTYEAVVELSDGGFVVLQQHVIGRPVDGVSDCLVASMLDFAWVRVGLAADHVNTGYPTPAYLIEDSPGFCLHEPARTHSRLTPNVVEAVERVGASLGDELGGVDVLHFDYHFGNVLVASDDPNRIAAFVDWGGARPGPIAVDLSVLAFDLAIRGRRDLRDTVMSSLQESANEEGLSRSWAHVALRLTDWGVRIDPEILDAVLDTAQLLLP